MTTSNHVAILDSNPAIWLVYLYLLVHNAEIWLAMSHSAPVYYHLFPKKVSIAWRLVTPSFFLKGYEVLSKYVALYAANVIKDGNTLKALDLFCKYGAPANPQVNLTFSLTCDTCYLFGDIIEITSSHQYFLFTLYLSAFFLYWYCKEKTHFNHLVNCSSCRQNFNIYKRIVMDVISMPGLRSADSYRTWADLRDVLFEIVSATTLEQFSVLLSPLISFPTWLV